MKRTHVNNTGANNKVSTGPRGASPTGGSAMPASSGLLRRILGLLVLVSMVIGTIYIAVRSFKFDVVIDRPVASVSVEGDFRFVSRERITELVTPLVNKKFLQLDLKAIKNSIEREAYVDYAVLSRKWPDRLSVRIAEQQPIARWGERGFLNQRGDIVETEQLEFLQQLPLLAGKREQAAKIMLQYQRISRLLRPYDLDVKELRSDDKFAWQLLLSNDLKVVVGRDQVLEKIQRFLTVYEQQLRGRLDDIARVDVRYENGVAVRWHKTAAVVGTLASRAEH